VNRIDVTEPAARSVALANQLPVTANPASREQPRAVEETPDYCPLQARTPTVRSECYAHAAVTDAERLSGPSR